MYFSDLLGASESNQVDFITMVTVKTPNKLILSETLLVDQKRPRELCSRGVIMRVSRTNVDNNVISLSWALALFL